MFRPLYAFLAWTFVFASWVSPIHAQLDDVSLDHLIEGTTMGSWFGAGLSTVDFDQDGWDDVSVSSSDGTVKLYLGGEDGLELHHVFQYDQEAKAVLWVDVDNDGDLDLLTGVMNEGVYLYIRHSDGALYEESEGRGMPMMDNWDVRGISARDYDGDMDLDLYICSYEDPYGAVLQPNILLRNNGGGYYSDVTEGAGVGNGLMHSFQGAWLDWNDDGLDDLWVINDRTIFPNALYRNVGNGTFVDVAEDIGANVAIDAMSATVFDADNDGDWDLYSTNTEDNANVFLRNDNGAYVDVSENAGIASLQYGWGTCAVDLDGDMFDDLMVATYRFPNANPYDNHLYMNAGDGTFVDMIEDWPNEQYQLYSIARIDLDGDHVPDMIGLGNSAHAQVLRNTNSEGASRLAIKLVGTVSNSQAIGAEVHVFAGGQHQMDQVSSGCDYVTQHTHTQFFGLDDETMVDSLIIEWPSGLVEAHFELPVDTLLTFIEGTQGAELVAESVPCPWSSAIWQVPFDPEVVAMTWNGVPVDSAQVTADSSGVYTLEATWWGQYTWSESVEVDLALPPEAVLSVEAPSCYGGMGMLSWSSPEAQSADMLGSSLANEGEGLALPVGEYPWTWLYAEGCEVQAVISVEAPEMLVMNHELEHPSCFGETGQASVNVLGGTEPYSLDWNGADPAALLPGTVLVTAVDAHGCVDTLTFDVVEPLPLVSELEVSYPVPGDSAWVSLSITGGTAPYDTLWTGDIWNLGWTVAPGALGWVVEDAQGCLTVGASDIGANPLVGVTPQDVPFLSPVRVGTSLTWAGQTDRVAQWQILDLAGRVWMVSTGPATDLDLSTESPLLFHVQLQDGTVRHWVR